MVNPVTTLRCAGGAAGFRVELCCLSVPDGDTLGQLAAEKSSPVNILLFDSGNEEDFLFFFLVRIF